VISDCFEDHLVEDDSAAFKIVSVFVMFIWSIV